METSTHSWASEASGGPLTSFVKVFAESSYIYSYLYPFRAEVEYLETDSLSKARQKSGLRVVTQHFSFVRKNFAKAVKKGREAVKAPGP